MKNREDLDIYGKELQLNGNFFRLSRYLIDNVNDTEMKKRLTRALRLSAHINENGRSEGIDIIDDLSLISHPIEISDFCSISLDQLYKYYIVLDRKDGASYMRYRNIIISDREFRIRSSKVYYTAIFRSQYIPYKRVQGTLRSNTYIFTYAEIQVLTDNYFSLRWDIN